MSMTMEVFMVKYRVSTTLGEYVVAGLPEIRDGYLSFQGATHPVAAWAVGQWVGFVEIKDADQ